MKKLRLLVVAMVVFSVIGISSVGAYAAQYLCTVDGAGPGGSAVYVQLTDTAASPAFTKRWFIPNTNFANQYLATALTAIANNQTVLVNLTSTTAYSTITYMYLQ